MTPVERLDLTLHRRHIRRADFARASNMAPAYVTLVLKGRRPLSPLIRSRFEVAWDRLGIPEPLPWPRVADAELKPLLKG